MHSRKQLQRMFCAGLTACAVPSLLLLLLTHRYKLSLLHRPSNQSPPTSITFKDFSEDKASTKAKKAAASKGFGAASAAAKQASAAAAAVATELTAEQLGEILSCNAYGDDHLDGPLTTCRGSEQGSIIGELKCCSRDEAKGGVFVHEGPFLLLLRRGQAVTHQQPHSSAFLLSK